MDINLQIGTKLRKEKEVTTNDTAAKYGSGLIEVFATPAMIALMENTALHCVLNLLPEGYNTVGTAVDIRHVKATPVGMKVSCEAELIEADDKKLVFKLTAYDEEGKIGFGTHKRYIIHSDSFMQNLLKK